MYHKSLVVFFLVCAEGSQCIMGNKAKIHDEKIHCLYLDDHPLGVNIFQIVKQVVPFSVQYNI